MSQRGRNWGFFALFIAVGWLIHPIFVRNLETVMERRGWDQLLSRGLERLPTVGGDMREYILQLLSGNGFWLGAFTVLFMWGALEFLYAYWRERRRSRNPFMDPMPLGTAGYVYFVPETGLIEKSYNISSVSDNGTGDFTISFEHPVSETLFRVSPVGGAKKPDEIVINSHSARVYSVQVKYSVEPDSVSLMFES